jgi:type VI secretion system protein ImpH
LGLNTVVGSRVWDQQAKVTLRVGPLTFAEFSKFLPSGSAFRPLVQLTRFFVGQEFDFDIQLVLKAVEVPWCRLGEMGDRAPRLGWSTWLKTGEFTHDAEDAVFAGHLTGQSSSGTEAVTQEGGIPHEREPEISDWQAERYLSQLA